MHTKTLAVAVLAVVAVVLVAWWFADGAAAQVPAPPTAGTGPRAAPAPVQGETAPGATAHDAAAERPVTVPVERTELRPQAAAAPSTDGYSVCGRLVDQNGAPRAAVELDASTWPADGSVGTPRPSALSATSGDDGRFALRVPAGRDGQLTVRDAQLEFAGATPRFENAAGDRDLGDLVVVRSGQLTGVVQDERGTPLADVKVEASLGAFAFGARSSTKTAADGSFTVGKLKPGRWLLRTASDRHMPTTLEVELAAEERRAGIVLVVRQGNAIAGQVVDDRGVGVGGIKVGCQRRELRGQMDIERFSADEATQTDARGWFTLSGLPGGVVTLRAFGPGHSGTTLRDVAVGSGDVVLRVQRVGAIEGVLVAAGGGPIAGSDVVVDVTAARAAFDPLDDVSFAAGGRVATAADGTFRIDGVTPGTVTVRATGKAHLPVQAAGLAVAPGATLTGVRLVADAGATARVTVVDVDGEPVAGATVRAANVPSDAAGGNVLRRAQDFEFAPDEVVFGGARSLGSATTAGDGVAELRGLPAAVLRFEATHDAFAPATPVDAMMPRNGTTDVRLMLSVPGFVDVSVVDASGAPLPAAKVRVEPVGGGSPAPWHPPEQDRRRDGNSDANGRLRLGPFGPGEYRAVLVLAREPQRVEGIELFGDDEAVLADSARTVTVVAGETAVVELRRPVLARVHGVVHGADGPVANCVVELCRDEPDDFGIPGFGSPTVQTDASGVFAFDEVEAGRYTLVFGKRHQLVKARQALDVASETEDVRADLVLRTGRVTLRAHDAVTGAPIEGAEVEVHRGADGTGAGSGPRMMFAIASTDTGGESMTMTIGAQRVRTDAEGRATVEDVPVGTYTVRVAKHGYGAVEREEQAVVERGTTDCGRVELASAGTLRAKVTAAGAAATDALLVQCRRVHERDWSTTELAIGGTATIGSLAPGRYAVRARRVGDAGEREGPVVEVDLQAGVVTEVALTVP